MSTAPPQLDADVDALRTRLHRLDNTWTPTSPGLPGRWSTTHALTGSFRGIPDDVEILVAHGMLRWARGRPGQGLVWQRTQAGSRWMRAKTKRLPKPPALRADVGPGYEDHARVVRVTDPLGYGALAIVIGPCDDDMWFARDAASSGWRAETPGEALTEFAIHAAADTRSDSEAVRRGGCGHEALRDLVDEATRILAHRADRLLAHVLEHADELGVAVLAPLGDEELDSTRTGTGDGWG